LFFTKRKTFAPRPKKIVLATMHLMIFFQENVVYLLVNWVSIFNSSVFIAPTAYCRARYMLSPVCLSVCPYVCHKGGSVKNGW